MPVTTDSSSIEKKGDIEHVSGSKHSDDAVSVDDFAGDSGLPPPPQLSKEEERKLYRKIDLRLMPILALMYLLSFMDRGRSAIMRAVHRLMLTSSPRMRREYW